MAVYCAQFMSATAISINKSKIEVNQSGLTRKNIYIWSQISSKKGM
jgi:hypothetical protein